MDDLKEHPPNSSPRVGSFTALSSFLGGYGSHSAGSHGSALHGTPSERHRLSHSISTGGGSGPGSHASHSSHSSHSSHLMMPSLAGGRSGPRHPPMIFLMFLLCAASLLLLFVSDRETAPSAIFDNADSIRDSSAAAAAAAVDSAADGMGEWASGGAQSGGKTGMSSSSSSSSSSGGATAAAAEFSRGSGLQLLSDSPTVASLLAGNQTIEAMLQWDPKWVGVPPEHYLDARGGGGDGERYLFVPSGGDFCTGMGHFRWSLLCRIAEAVHLNRSLVLDLTVCLDAGHSGEGYGALRPLYAYFDLHEARNHFRFTPLQGFREALKQHNQQQQQQQQQHSPLPTYLVPKLQDSSGLTEQGQRGDPLQLDKVPLRLDEVPLIIRNVSTAADFGFEICDRAESASFHRDWSMLHERVELQQIAAAIVAQMNSGDFDAVHVRRGDKALQSQRWPNLKQDTHPDALLKRLPELTPPGRALFISSDEHTPGFFDPLKKHYPVVKVLADFKELWGEGSEWKRVYTEMLGAENAVFDSHMEAIVDYGVTRAAKKVVETFNELTKDPREGLL